MTQTKTQIGDVTYNAANQAFEALVTFYTDAGRIRVASRYNAPLTADFTQISDGLWHNAIKSLNAPDALQARLQVKRSTVTRDVQVRGLPQITAWLRSVTGQRQAA